MKHGIKIVRDIFVLGSAIALLGGCHPNMEGKDDKGISPHLTVDLQVPAPADSKEAVALSVEVKKNGKPVTAADQAIFVVWPEHHSDHKFTVQAKEQTPGIYGASYMFPSEGLYIVQSRIAAGNLEVMPSKRVAIGEETVHLLNAMETSKRNADDDASKGGNHDH